MKVLIKLFQKFAGSSSGAPVARRSGRNLSAFKRFASGDALYRWASPENILLNFRQHKKLTTLPARVTEWSVF